MTCRGSYPPTTAASTSLYPFCPTNAADGFAANVLKFDAGWNSDRVEGLLSSGKYGNQPVGLR